MILRPVFFLSLCVLALLAPAGCVPSAQSQSDEEKESHFLAGKSRVSTMDYKGAIESFEKALEVNPHSASAHFELGCLYDQSEPAAAIYHFDKYLKLRPEAGNADVVKQRINTCKQELAKNINLGPLSDRQQRELEALIQTNRTLEGQVKLLSQQVDSWQAYALRLQGLTNATPAQARISNPIPQPPAIRGPNRVSAPTNLISSRTHTGKNGETLTTIARKYGVRVEMLTAANPNINDRRLRVGQVLQVPGS